MAAVACLVRRENLFVAVADRRQLLRAWFAISAVASLFSGALPGFDFLRCWANPRGRRLWTLPAIEVALSQAASLAR